MIVTREDGKELPFASIIEARTSMGIGRGLLEQILAGKAKRTTFMVDGEPIKATVRYDV